MHLVLPVLIITIFECFLFCIKWLLYHVWNDAELQYVLSKVSDNLHEWQMQAKGNKVFVLVGAIQIVCNEIGMCLYLKK